MQFLVIYYCSSYNELPKSTVSLLKIFHKVQLLVVPDPHRIVGKPSIPERFCPTINVQESSLKCLKCMHKNGACRTWELGCSNESWTKKNSCPETDTCMSVYLRCQGDPTCRIWVNLRIWLIFFYYVLSPPRTSSRWNQQQHSLLRARSPEAYHPINIFLGYSNALEGRPLVKRSPSCSIVSILSNLIFLLMTPLQKQNFLTA